MAVEYSVQGKEYADIEQATSLEMLAEHGWRDELESLLPTGGDMGELTLGEPYRVRHLSLESFLGERFFNQFLAERWRRFLLFPCLTLAEIEFSDRFEPIAFYRGPAKDGLRAAMEIAEQIQGKFRGSVILSAPLKLAALRLEGDEDLLIPFPPNLTPLENYEPIPTEKAREVLQSLAKDIAGAAEEDDTSGG